MTRRLFRVTGCLLMLGIRLLEKLGLRNADKERSLRFPLGFPVAGIHHPALGAGCLNVAACKLHFVVYRETAKRYMMPTALCEYRGKACRP